MDFSLLDVAFLIILMEGLEDFDKHLVLFLLFDLKGESQVIPGKFEQIFFLRHVLFQTVHIKLIISLGYD
jgi:hypothetical protein